MRELGEANVADERFALRVEEDVGRLEVAVQDTALVREVDGAGGFADKAGSGTGRGVISEPVFSEAAAALD